MLMKVVLYLAAGYALLAGLVYAVQSRLVFHPVRELAGTPADLGIDHEEVRVPAENGAQLHGWFIPAEDAEWTVLFCHGNAGNISHRLDTIRMFHENRWNLFIFDYRGYGQSGGRPSEQKTYQDAWAAWNYLTGSRGIAPGRIVILGRSLGGPIGAWLAAKTRPAGLAIESSFTSLADIGAEIYPFLPVRWLSTIKYPTRDLVREVSCPVLIVHSAEDDVVPFRHGRAIFEAAGEPKTFLEIHGDHNEGFLLSEPAYVQGFTAFLKSLPVR